MLNIKNSQHLELTKGAGPELENLGKKLFKPYLLQPQKDTIPENQKDSTPIIYVNGMNMSTEAIFQSAQLLANTCGRAVYVVPNDKEQNIFQDLTNSALSLFSSEQGSKAESESVEHVASILRARLEDDSPVHLFAYSQGSLIVKDSLWQLHKELIDNDKKAQWDHLASRIRLTTTAAATRNFPPGIAVKENWHSGDPIVVVSSSSAAAHTIAGYDDSIPPSIAVYANQADRMIPNLKKSHSITEYIENTEHFFLDRISDLSITAQVRTLKSSIAQGEYCDRQYHEIIDALTSTVSKEIAATEVNQEIASAQLRAKLFAKEFLKSFPDGKIDSFTLPKDQLEKLEVSRDFMAQKPAVNQSNGWLSKLSGIFSRNR